MSIQITFEKDVEDLLRAEWGDVERAAREALAIESYRTGKVGYYGVARMLGLETSIAAQMWLGERGVYVNHTLEDLEEDRRNLAELFPDFKP